MWCGLLVSYILTKNFHVWETFLRLNFCPVLCSSQGDEMKSSANLGCRLTRLATLAQNQVTVNERNRSDDMKKLVELNL